MESTSRPKNEALFDLADPANAYAFGFLQADGTHYLRGIIDADGSVGFTARGWPFISLVTASPAIATFTCAEILRVTGTVRTTRPNTRDGVMNILIATDPAVEFARWLYADASIAMERKREAARAVTGWERPASMRAWSNRRRWTPAEDAIVSNMSPKDAAKTLGRTKQSVSMRRWRLNAQSHKC